MTTDGTGDPQWEARTNFASSSLNNGNIYVGDASGVATGVTMSGDATLANDGTLTIAGDAITTAKIKDGEIANADINAGAKIDATKIADGSVTNTEFQYINSLSSNAQTQIDNINTSINGINTLADGNIYLGDASGNAQEVTLSGDVTMDNDGTLPSQGMLSLLRRSKTGKSPMLISTPVLKLMQLRLLMDQ